VGVKHFSELAAWKLANDVRARVFEITSAGRAAGDFDFRLQIRSAADSACDNVAEGFARYGHREFCRFLTIAVGSLAEVESQMFGALAKRYFTPEVVGDARVRIARARRAMVGLKRHLTKGDAPRPFEGRGA
jgi:carbamoyl-phosphate synthase large subunit